MTEPADTTPDSSPAAQPDASGVDELLGGYAGVDPADADVDALLGGYQGMSSDEVASAKAAAAARPASSGAPLGAGASAPGDLAAIARAKRAKKVSDEPKGFRPWMLWWIPTALIPLVGGGVAWMVLRDRRPEAARLMVSVGLATGVIASMLFFRYATQIAFWVTGISRDTVIIQPSTTAVP